MSATSVLDELLEPLSRCLDSDSARRLIDLKATPHVQERINVLAGRANQGTLTPEETSEYEALINVADFISILKLKAEQRLTTTD